MVTTKPLIQKPALIVEGNKLGIVITDLHIGFENELASNDIFIGKNTSTLETQNELNEIIEKQNPDYLVLLGDVKSSIKNISKLEWSDVPTFLEKFGKKIETILIPGNHDGNIDRLVPQCVSVTSSFGAIIENILFTHGHTMPPETFSKVDKIVMGHVHPVFFEDESILNGQRVWVSIRTKKEQIFPSTGGEIEIIIVPSFNRYFYASHRRYRKSISPIIEKIKEMSSAKIVTLDGTIIGNEAIIHQVI